MTRYPYHIEFRLGPEKWKIRSLIRELGNHFSVKTPRVPHITLYGPFRLVPEAHLDRSLLYDKLNPLLSESGRFHYLIDGYEFKRKSRGREYVFALRIKPSRSIETLRRGLVEELSTIAEPKHRREDAPAKEFWPHITISNGLSKRKVRQIKKRLEKPFWRRVLEALSTTDRYIVANRAKPLYPIDLLRFTVLFGRKILREYDLVRGRWLKRQQALDKKEWAHTLGEYRRMRGFEVQEDASSINQKGRRASDPKTFVVADTHFDHNNIIKYCLRPFIRSWERQMNQIIIDNWNTTVNPDDRVYFLGDLVYGRKSRPPRYFLEKLNGDIEVIKGNHDRFSGPKTKTIEFRGYTFQLVHDPNETGVKNGDWLIHGHKHNNDLRNYPFINFDERRINTSVEVLGYKPTSLDTLVNKIDNREPGQKKELVAFDRK